MYFSYPISEEKTTCLGATLNNNFDLHLSCLVYQGLAYTTDLYTVDQKGQLAWVWSGKLTPNHCSIDLKICSTVSENLDLTIRKVNINGRRYTGNLQYDSLKSQSSKHFWNYFSHVIEP